MSNGARHTWGILLGLILTAALVAALTFGTHRVQVGYVDQGIARDKWIGIGLIATAAVIFAVLAASRLSPLGSLIGGLAVTAVGLLFFVSRQAATDLIDQYPIDGQRVTLTGLEQQGVVLFVGVGLLFASFFPSRWRPRDGVEESATYEYGIPATGEAQPKRGGRHAVRDVGTAQPYDGGTPLYEPKRSYGDGLSFTRREEGGGTQEFRRSFE